jgi:hypothetical protein
VGYYLNLPTETHVAIEDAILEMEIANRLGLFNSISLAEKVKSSNRK